MANTVGLIGLGSLMLRGLHCPGTPVALPLIDTETLKFANLYCVLQL